MTSTITYTDDAAGKLTVENRYDNSDGIFDAVISDAYKNTYTYTVYDNNADSKPDFIRTYTYNTNGKLTSISYNENNDDKVNARDTYSSNYSYGYDTNDNVTAISSYPSFVTTRREKSSPNFKR